MLDALYDEPLISSAKKLYSLHTVVSAAQHSVSPCSAACPAGVDIPKMQSYVKQGRFLKAFEKLITENPFPSICGRICFRSCETACYRMGQDEALAIGSIGRFVGDRALNNDFSPSIKKLPLNGKRIAVLGAGPSGLSAAYFLSVFGFSCEVYESAPTPGKSVQWDIPESRLPEKVLNLEIDRIRDLGVSIKCGHCLDPDFVKGLMSSCHAVVVGSGISQAMTFSSCVTGDESTLQGALQTRGEDAVHIELGNVTIKLGAIPVVYGGGWYNGIQSIAHAVGAGKTAAIALYAYFDTGISAIRESVEISRVGNGMAQSMEIYLLGERSQADNHVVTEKEIDRTGFHSAPRIDAPRSMKPGSGNAREMLEQTFDLPSALAEASRCYGCGYRGHAKNIHH